MNTIIRVMFYAGLASIVAASFVEWGLTGGLGAFGFALVAGAFIESMVDG